MQRYASTCCIWPCSLGGTYTGRGLLGCFSVLTNDDSMLLGWIGSGDDLASNCQFYVFDDQDILACIVMSQRLSQDVSLSVISPSVYYLGIL